VVADLRRDIKVTTFTTVLNSQQTHQAIKPSFGPEDSPIDEHLEEVRRTYGCPKH
jgi:hypothetical protein